MPTAFTPSWHVPQFVIFLSGAMSAVVGSILNNPEWHVLQLGFFLSMWRA